MEDNSKYECESKKQTHFTKFHEKVLNKLNQMKTKLAKSKSTSALTSLSDNYDYKQKYFYSSYMDIPAKENNNKERKEEKDKDNFADDVEEIDVSSFQELSDLSATSGHKVYRLKSRLSLAEELFETSAVENETKEDDPEVRNGAASSRSQRLSLRDKITIRITAAKEKRKKEEYDKLAIIEKKRISREKLEKYLYNCTTPSQKLAKKKQKLATISVAVLEAKIPQQLFEEDNCRTFFCRLKLGSEKRKTKTLRSCSALTVNWQELFNLCLYDDPELEISMWDNTIFIGRYAECFTIDKRLKCLTKVESDRTLVCMITVLQIERRSTDKRLFASKVHNRLTGCYLDISELDKEKTHKIHITTSEGEANVELFILLTVTGIATSEEYVDPEDIAIVNEELARMNEDYKWYKVKKFKEVGRLCVMVYSAKGLSEKDCFCVVELDNERLQTATIYKTNNPCWMKLFKFDLTDVTKILEITVVDEKKYEEVGKVMIPLLNVSNGEKRWYTLKDNTLRERAKGTNPRIFLEIWVAWNIVKASIRVINPKEARYLKTVPKLDRQTFGRNWARTKVILNWLGDAKKTVTTCFEWESKKWNTIGIAAWLLLCSYARLWMIPLFLLIPFAYYGREKNFLIEWEKYIVGRIYRLKDIEEKMEKSQTLKQKINNIHDIVQTAQNTIGKFASLGEQVKNLFNFTVPYLSLLSIVFILLISLVLSLVPGHLILMIWGLHKFTRKIIKPDRIPNNELLDLLSRVPDDEKLMDYSEVPVHTLSDDNDLVDIDDI